MNKINIFCFGFGQVAEAFINKLINRNINFKLGITSRKDTHKIEINNIKINSYMFENDKFDESINTELEKANYILISIPPRKKRDVVLGSFRNLLKKSNLFLMPSILYKKSVEGFGIVYIEAAQYGVPSIGGKDGGASDAILHEKTGLICDGNNLEEIYSSIDKMLKDHKYKEYGKEAKKFSENFYWDKIIKSYQKIL